MNRYRWNLLNNAQDLVFVVNAKTREFVLKNNVFDELLQAAEENESASLADLMPQKAGSKDPLSEIISYLSTQAEGAKYQEEYTQQVFGRGVTVQMTAGYFDENHDEVYFVLRGYHSILELMRFQNSISKIPQNIIVLEMDSAFSVYCVNEEFERNFGAGAGEGAQSFQAAFANSFSNAIPVEKRMQYLMQIGDGFTSDKTVSLMMELCTSAGTQHHVMLTLKYAKELLEHVVLCGTVQIMDESVQQYQALQNEHEVYTVATHFSNSVLFRLDLNTMRVSLFGEAIKSFNLQALDGADINEIAARGIVLQEDAAVFQGLIADMRAGIERIARMRMHAADGRKDWYMVEYKIAKGKGGNPEQAVGKITNVQKNQELQEKATIDLLTNCMNKGTFEASCMNLLSEQSTEDAHVFFIIDLDNFKAVNDNLGHFFGDIVLKEVATKLKRIFRNTDYIARIGGDEFAVLMQSVASEDTIRSKAEEIVKQIDITYRGGGSSYRISASVGVAYYPLHANNYEDIYRRADLALYHAKNTGKNAYKVYEASLEQGTMANTTPFDVANRAFSHFFDQQVAMDTFSLLFEGSDSNETINMILRHLGERFSVDRCYIFSATNEECTAFSNTYEWCREGITPEIDNLQNLPFEVFDSCFKQANAEGVFYCDDVSKLEHDGARETLEAQGIISMLHTYVQKDGLYRYTLGFDDCSSKRIWKPSEISTLMYASKIIAQYLLYNEALEQAASSAREQLEVINNLNFHAYIVDNETHQIRYYNDLTKRVLPDIQIGDYCYQAVRGKTSECHDCPLRILRENSAEKARAIIHNEVLGTDYLVTASALSSFEGHAATFVSSTDISDLLQDTGVAHTALEQYIQFDQ